MPILFYASFFAVSIQTPSPQEMYLFEYPVKLWSKKFYGSCGEAFGPTEKHNPNMFGVHENAILLNGQEEDQYENSL